MYKLEMNHDTWQKSSESTISSNHFMLFKTFSDSNLINTHSTSFCLIVSVQH